MSALKAIRKFRLHELNGLQAHIKRFGPLKTTPSDSLSDTSTPSPTILPNPFLPRLNPNTGRWAPPKYSLRRQADLIKKARAEGIVHLLPPGPKLVLPVGEKSDFGLGKDEWAQDVHWDGTVKSKPKGGNRSGLYSGKKRMFKGHKWERTTLAREKKRKTLMRYMKDRITKFKTVWRPIQIGSFNDALPDLSSLSPVSPSETTQSSQTRPFWEVTEITILVESISGPGGSSHAYRLL